jgi:hypothetical protein
MNTCKRRPFKGCIISAEVTVLFAVAAAISARAADEEIPTTVVDRVKHTVEQHSEKIKGFEAKYGAEEISIAFRCHPFKTHSITKGGQIMQKAKVVVGPSDEGFLLYLRFSPSLDNDRPFAYEQTSREMYWSTKTGNFVLNQKRGIVYLTFMFGAKADSSLFESVVDSLSEDSDRYTVGRLPKRSRIDEILRELEQPLQKLVAAKFPASIVQLSSRELTASFRVQEFVVHEMSSDGTLATDAHSEVGPFEDGFVIRIHGVRQVARGSDLPIVALSKRAYWTSYVNSFSPEHKGISSFYPYDYLQLEILYGSKTDRSLLNEVEGLIATYGRPAIRGVFESNRVPDEGTDQLDKR